MPDFKIWIREPYPFRWEELQPVRKAIERMYGVDIRYIYGQHSPTKIWHDVVEIEDVTRATARQIAASLKLFHLQKAIAEYRSNSRVHAEDVEVEVRGDKDSPPEWARPAWSAYPDVSPRSAGPT